MSNRSIKILLFIIILIIPLVNADALADSTTIPVTKMFFHMGNNLGKSFTSNYGLTHLIAIGLTIGMVESDWDHEWNDYFLRHESISDAAYFSVAAGSAVPILAPAGIYIYGRIKKNRDLQITACALEQAVILAVATSSTYKAVTGRRKPPHDYTPNDLSRDFHFGFLRRGVFAGWPSGHAMNAFAMGTTLRELYPDNSAVRVGTLAYSSLIAAGVSTNIHWLSDAIAGSLIGYTIGKVVGHSFAAMKNGNDTQRIDIFVLPTEIRLGYRF